MYNIFKSAPKNYEDLDGSTFKSNFQNLPKAELLDVRTAGEFNGGTIKGAKNFDVSSSQFQSALKTLDKDKEYYVFCRSGNRSGSDMALLKLIYLSRHITNPKEPDEKIAGVKIVMTIYLICHRT